MNFFFMNTGKQAKFVEILFWPFGIDAEHPVEIINAMG
jgi:hypothetical protein